jgi:putative acetyltransferase
MDIREDDLRGDEIIALLQEHLEHMHAITPPQSIHALDLDRLRSPEITFWTAWDRTVLMGCGALKALDDTSGEIKSMRTAAAYRRCGVATAVLNHIIQEAQTRNYQYLYLETGAFEAFVPAHRLYQRHGFEFCPPFGDYTDDPNSVFMMKRLSPS